MSEGEAGSDGGVHPFLRHLLDKAASYEKIAADAGRAGDPKAAEGYANVAKEYRTNVSEHGAEIVRTFERESNLRVVDGLEEKNKSYWGKMEEGLGILVGGEGERAFILGQPVVEKISVGGQEKEATCYGVMTSEGPMILVAYDAGYPDGTSQKSLAFLLKDFTDNQRQNLSGWRRRPSGVTVRSLSGVSNHSTAVEIKLGEGGQWDTIMENYHADGSSSMRSTGLSLIRGPEAEEIFNKSLEESKKGAAKSILEVETPVAKRNSAIMASVQ